LKENVTISIRIVIYENYNIGYEVYIIKNFSFVYVAGVAGASIQAGELYPGTDRDSY
jgi:UDP-3-O-[3-hydroxymyristoyl] glucosamine N-acyltransferase